MSQQIADPSRLAQQVLTATNSMTDEEAGHRYQQILAQLPKEEAAQLNALALSQVSQGERKVLASGLKSAHQDPNRPFDGYNADDDDAATTPQSLGRMSAQAAQQDPDLLGSLLGGKNSGLGGQIGKAALAALAAILIRKYLSGDQSAQTGGATGPVASAPGMDPVSAILGSILGGATGASQQQAGGSGDLGSILGSVLGGAMGGGQTQQAGGAGDLGSILGSVLGGSTSGGQQGGGDLGSILGSVLGGAMGGGQTQQAGGAGDLGSILGSILGGATGKPSYRKE